MDRWVAIGLLAALLVPLGLVQAAEGTPLSRETFTGTVNATGHPRVADASVGPHGNLTGPERAQTATVHVRWERSPDAEIELEVQDAPCDPTCPSPIGEDTGEHEARVNLRVPEDGQLHWHVTATNGTAIDEPFQGTVTWQAPAASETARAPETRSAATSPAPDTGGDLSWAQQAGATLAFATLGLWVWSRRRLGLWTVAIGLYHRIQDHELLENEKRARIHRIAREEPGVHYGELRSRLDVSRGALEHHLRRLLDADLIVEERAAGYRCFFLAGHLDRRERAALAALRADSSRRIVQVLADAPGLGLRELARAIDRAPSTVSHHLDHLQDAGIVAAERSGGLKLSLTNLGTKAARHVAD